MPARKRRAVPKSVRIRHDPARVVLFGAVSTPEQAIKEKASLDNQFETLENAATANGWVVWDRIVIPGFSRNWFNYREFSDAAAEAGIDDPQRMWQHWENGEVDIIACINVSRLGRQQSIIFDFVDRTYNAGMQIFTLKNGLIAPDQRYMTFMMESFAAASEPLEIVRRIKFGMDKRLRNGLPSVKPPISHKYVRDPDTGKAVKMVVDETRRPLLNAIRDVLLEGVGWSLFSDAIHERGFTNPENGKLFGRDYFKHFLLSGNVWGNSVKRDPEVADEKSIYGLWCVSSAVPPPPGIQLFFDTHEPAYTGDEAERMQAHLIEFRIPNTGRARPATRKKFSRLLVCNECHRLMLAHMGPKGERYYRCQINMDSYYVKRGVCHNRTVIRESKVQAWLSRLLQQAVESDSPDEFFQAFYPVTNYAAQIADLESQINHANERARVLIVKQGNAPALADLYDEQIQIINREVIGLQGQLDGLRIRAQQSEIPGRKPALETIINLGDDFWQQSDTLINVGLTNLLAGLKLLIQDGEIVDLAPVPPLRPGKPRQLLDK